MNSTPSQGQTQQQPSPGANPPQAQPQSGAAEGLNQPVPEDGDDVSRQRGDSNRTPRQEQQPLGTPPQPGRSLSSAPQNAAGTDDADDEGDTRPSDDTGTQPAGRS